MTKARTVQDSDDTREIPAVPGAGPAVPRPEDPGPGVDARDARRWPTAHRVLVAFVAVLGGAQVIGGLVWWAVNLAHVPAYGDTPEYLALSETLEVDEYRTLLYPALIRLASSFSFRTGLPFQLPLYLLQTGVAVAAIWYLVRSAAPRASRWSVGAATALVATSPLVLHYMVSVLSDSLGASLLLVALVGVTRMVVRDDRRGATLAVTFLAALGAGLMRTEKWMVLTAFAVVALLVLVLLRRRPGLWTPGQVRRTGLAVVLALLLPAGIAVAVNDATQTADYDRPRPTGTTAAVSRIVWPHLAEIRHELPAEAQAAISQADAEAFDAEYNEVLPMTSLMQDLDDGGNTVTHAAVRAALGCCLGTVALSTTGDVVEFALAPVTFAREGWPAVVSSDPPPTATRWAVTRMDAAHPTMTHVLLLISWALLPILVAAAVAGRLRPTAPAHVRRARHRRTAVLLGVWLGASLNGWVFAAVQGTDANLRYGLAVMVALTAALVVWAIIPASRADGLRDDPAGTPA